jgi:hypothetical protein
MAREKYYKKELNFYEFLETYPQELYIVEFLSDGINDLERVAKEKALKQVEKKYILDQKGMYDLYKLFKDGVMLNFDYVLKIGKKYCIIGLENKNGSYEYCIIRPWTEN